MKLIDKDQIVAEMERRKNLCEKIALDLRNQENKDYYQGKAEAYKEILDTLNALETEEVDLTDAKKEELRQKYIDYTFKRYNIDENSREGQLIYYAYMHGINQCLTQLREQKGGKDV